MPKKSCSISVIHLRFVKIKLNKGKLSTMTLQYKIYLFTVKLFDDHGIKVDRAELLSLRNFDTHRHPMGDITAGMAGHSICVQQKFESNELYGLVQCHTEMPLHVLKRYLYTEQH